MTNFRSATDLTSTARADLVAFCADNLKTDLDAQRYADAMIADCTFDDDMAHFEIRALHAKSGNPATISFTGNELVWTEFDEDGNQVG